MSGTREGALRTAAARVGLGANEYLDRLNNGERYCYRCADWHPAGEFSKDASRSDGLARACRASLNAAARARYLPKSRPAAGRQFVPARDGDAAQARRRVNHLVDVGLLPPPNTLPCTDCSHVWSDGERRHEYDHHLGYAAEHHEDVEPVCTTCHHRRGDERGETA